MPTDMEDTASMSSNGLYKNSVIRVKEGDKSTKMPSVCCREVSHSQQSFNWDCGLSCVLMALDAADAFEVRETIRDNLEDVCKKEGFGHSTWTVDLCYLLKHYLPKLSFFYATITLGVDPSYMNQVFYNKILNRDSERVQERFDQAEANGISLREGSVSIQEIVQHLSESGTCIVLTNANLLSCETCSYFILCGNGDRATSTSCLLLRTCGSDAYQGHYVLAVGFDLPKQKIYYRNPTLRDRVCTMSFDRFNEARTSYGTDEDVIFVGTINDKENKLLK